MGFVLRSRDETRIVCASRRPQCRVNLTQKIVEATPAPLGRKSVDYFDRRMPGLVLRVSAGGTKSWNAVYRHHGRSRRLTIGRYPIIALDDARNRAREALSPSL